MLEPGWSRRCASPPQQPEREPLPAGGGLPRGPVAAGSAPDRRVGRPYTGVTLNGGAATGDVKGYTNPDGRPRAHCSGPESDKAALLPLTKFNEKGAS